MASAIVDAIGVAKGVSEIGGELHDGRVDVLREGVEEERRSGVGEAGVPGAEGGVAVSGGVIDRRDFVDPNEKSLEEGDKGVGEGGNVAGVRELAASDGVAEGGDEAEEVAAGGRVEEATSVGGGEDLGRRDKEGKGRGEDGDFLGLRDRREDYGFGVRRRKIESRGADGAIDGRVGQGRKRSGPTGSNRCGATTGRAARMVFPRMLLIRLDRIGFRRRRWRR